MGKMSQGVRNGPCCVYQFLCTYLTAPGAKYLSTLLSVWGVACLSLFMNCLDSCARAVEGPTGSTERRPKRNTPRVRRAQRMLSLGQRGWSNISPRNVVSCACFVDNMLETFQIYKKTSAPTFVFLSRLFFLKRRKWLQYWHRTLANQENNGICNWVSWVVAKKVAWKKMASFRFNRMFATAWNRIDHMCSEERGADLGR